MIATAITSRQQTLSCDRESLLEWKVTMRTSNTQARKFGATVGKVVMALVFTLMIGSIAIAPAFARDNDRGHGGGRHEARGHYRGDRYYPAPVYAPPPVVYDPYAYQSPGISLAFPIRIR